MQQSYEIYLKNAINCTNFSSLTPLDLTIDGKNEEVAESLLMHAGPLIKIDAIQSKSVAVVELHKIVPCNQQSDVTDPAMVYHAEKMHPIVTTIINGMFDTTGKLLELALASHNKTKSQSPQQNNCFNLNSSDKDGMTYLHHLFVNFDQNPEKAGKLFRKMNQMHVQQLTLPRRNNIVIMCYEEATGKVSSARNSPALGMKRLVDQLNLNCLTNFGESPLDMAIEHQ